MGGQTARIACILEYIFWALSNKHNPPKEISQDTMIKAIVLIEDYFKPMAEKVLSECLRDNSCDVAQAFIRYLADNKISRFNLRELKRKHVLNFEQQAEDDFLLTLIDANVIEQIATNKTGRPSKDYAVNPKLMEIKL
jgi:predicted AAA+ superfamily ATPase